MTLQKRNFDYKWIVLAVCFLMEFICLGFCSSNPGLYKKAITDALNFDRTLFSITYSIRYVVTTFASLLFGALTNRFGIRKMASVGMLCLIASVSIFSFADSLALFYLGGAFWGFGITFCGGTMASSIVRRWFDKDIGTYTGLVLSANGIGGAVAAQIITPLINSGSAFGYRSAYRLAAALSLVITILVVSLLRDRPAIVPRQETAQKKQRDKAWVGISYDAARKKPFFYLLALMVFLTGISIQSITSISSTYLLDLGFSPKFVGNAATVSAIVLTFSKVLVGTVYDKKGLRFSMLMCQFAIIFSFIINANLVNSKVGQVFAILATSLSSLALPLETIMLPLITNDLFGRTDYVKVLGIFTAMNSTGLCLGAPVGELFFSLFHTYVPAMWVFCGIMIAVTVCFQLVLNKAYKEKALMLATE